MASVSWLCLVVMVVCAALALYGAEPVSGGIPSPCHYCTYCQFCDRCGTCANCVGADSDDPTCVYCKYCKYCVACKVCDSMCQEGGLMYLMGDAISWVSMRATELLGLINPNDVDFDEIEHDVRLLKDRLEERKAHLDSKKERPVFKEWKRDDKLVNRDDIIE